jgi:hypothetical protein
MSTKSTRSAFSCSATETGSPMSELSGLNTKNVEALSVAIAGLPLAWKKKVGMWAWCSGSHSESDTADWLRVTATTSFSTIWLAQSVAPAGSPPVSHVTTSTGRPPMPPLCSFQ